MYVQVNIGRNVASVPMSEHHWGSFQASVLEALGELIEDVTGQMHINLGDYVETHRGEGHWGGTGEPEEESVHFSAVFSTNGATGSEVAEAMTAFTRELRYLAEQYGQEAIALITGSRLIKPRRR